VKIPILNNCGFVAMGISTTGWRDYNKNMFHYVYVLQSLKNGSLYIGYTKDLKQRLKRHNSGGGSYTKKYMPWQLIHYEAYRNEDDAKRREKYLKTSQGSRLLKRMLKEYFYSQKLGK
jgi:putative endonuclease